MSEKNQEMTTTIMKLRLLFHEYYSKNPKTIDVPEKIHTREFAIQAWENNWRCRKQTGTDDSGNKVQTGCGKSGKSFKPITQCPSCGSKAVSVTSWTRHEGYKSKDDLLRNLAKLAPHSIYHSAAFYGFPTAISIRPLTQRRKIPTNNCGNPAAKVDAERSIPSCEYDNPYSSIIAG